MTTQWKGTDGETPTRAAVSFPSTGGADVSSGTLGAIFLASSAELLRALRSKVLNRKERRETRAKFVKKTAHRHRSQGIPKGHGGRKLNFIIDVRSGLTKLRPGAQCAFNPCLRQRRHDLVAGRVRMQAVLSEIALQ
jgi:hypothetical protein